MLSLLNNLVKLIELPSGKTSIGSSHSLPEESPRHEVTIREDLLLSETPITYKVFKQFVSETNYKTLAEIDGGSKVISNNQMVFQKYLCWKTSFAKDNYPVTCIAYLDAVNFCQWATAKEREAQQISSTDTVRLPSENEWEHANQCQSKKTDLSIEDFAWYANNSDGSPHPVKTKLANSWGYYDLLGNVSEWTLSDFKPYHDNTSQQSIFKDNQDLKVIKGGSWASPNEKVTGTMRGRANINSHCYYSGFRIILEKNHVKAR